MKSKVNISKSTIDWSKINLMIEVDGIEIVLTSGIQTDFSFSGMRLWSQSSSNIGEFSTLWHKDRFIPFQGTITLEND